jgi:hypothetical protein
MIRNYSIIMIRYGTLLYEFDSFLCPVTGLLHEGLIPEYFRVYSNCTKTLKGSKTCQLAVQLTVLSNIG